MNYLYIVFMRSECGVDANMSFIYKILRNGKQSYALGMKGVLKLYLETYSLFQVKDQTNHYNS